MAKKFGKTLAFLAMASAVCAGVYYFLTKEDSECEDCSKDDKAKDINDFFTKKEKAEAEREYVNLGTPACDLGDKPENEVLKNVVTKAAEELQEKAEEIKDGVGIVKDSAEASEFSFEKFEENEDDTPDEAEAEAEAVDTEENQ